MTDIAVIEFTDVGPVLVEGMQLLVPQLSKTSPVPTVEQLQAIVSSQACALFGALNNEGKMIGSLTLVFFMIPTGARAIIEDVVVDDAARGAGVGELLTRAALDKARSVGCKTVDLTSRPSREAANRLYQRVGFVQRETNVYRYEIV